MQLRDAQVLPGTVVAVQDHHIAEEGPAEETDPATQEWAGQAGTG